MAHSRSHSQPIQYRYRPNAPVRAATTAPKRNTAMDYQSPSSHYSSSQAVHTPAQASLETAFGQAYMQNSVEADLAQSTTFLTPLHETTLSFPATLQSMEYPPLASPLASSWTSPNGSVTSDGHKGAWSSPASTMSFSPEPNYQIPYMEGASWPSLNQNSYFSDNCISMPEAFPAFAMDSDYDTTPLYYPQMTQQWPNQFIFDGSVPAYETTEFCSSHGSPESVTEQASRSNETVVAAKLRSDSMMTDASTISSPEASSKSSASSSPRPRQKSQYEGQLLEFSSPVAQVKSKGPKSAALPCPLAAYGCTSSFISKNEWKRHINTQHLRLEAWLCDQCPKRDNKREFNRKDLFIQHLKRMHPSPCSTHSPKTQPAKSKSVRSGSKTDKATKPSKGEDLDPALLVAEQRCHITLRQPPGDSACLFCPTNFSGRGSWEARIEHIAKHMEQNKKDGGDVSDPNTWRADRALEQWLISEGVISKVRQRWSIV